MSNSETANKGGLQSKNGLFNHPKGLLVLFWAELWERFSFYGMRALLVLYITKQLLLDDTSAYGIYGAYGALVYASSLVGGYIADHFTGMRRAVFMGGAIIAMGHFVMALPAVSDMLSHTDSLFLGLALIVMGTGFFKGNISALLGELYNKNDSRLDSGYTIFYMSVNIGAFFAPFACGYLGEVYGWHYGFGLAGIGMASGLLILYYGRDQLNVSNRCMPKSAHKKVMGIPLGILSLVLSLLMVPIAFYAIGHNQIAQTIVNTGAFLALAYIGYCIWQSNADERKAMLTLVVMLPFVMSFFACFEQAGSSINLFTDRHIDRMVGDFLIPTSWFQSLNPLFIIIFAPLFSKLWLVLGAKGKDPITPIKMMFALLQVALGFGCLMIGIKTATTQGITSLVWLVLAIFFHTTGELCLSPVGLSMISKISPTRFVGFMMGCFYLSIAFSHLVAAGIAKIASVGNDLPIDAIASISLAGFGEAFQILVYFPLGAAVVLLFITPLVRGVFERYR